MHDQEGWRCVAEKDMIPRRMHRLDDIHPHPRMNDEKDRMPRMTRMIGREGYDVNDMISRRTPLRTMYDIPEEIGMMRMCRVVSCVGKQCWTHGKSTEFLYIVIYSSLLMG